jgi:hypothetical protein
VFSAINTTSSAYNKIAIFSPSISIPIFNDLISGEVFDYVSSYQYLGLVLNEFLHYQFMAKAIARSASRALGLLIVKSKTHGGFQHNIFTKLYQCLKILVHFSTYGGFQPMSPATASLGVYFLTPM